MADTTYIVKWDTEPANNGGTKKDDLPKGIESYKKQREFLKDSEEGRAVLNSLKSLGYDITDVQDEPVYRVRDKGIYKYWVPYGRWYQSYHPVGNKTHYALVHIEKQAPSAEDLQADIDQHRAEQAAELERHKAEQAAELERMRGEMELQKQKLQAEVEMAKIRAEMDALKSQAMGASVPGATPGSAPAGLRTYEVFGLLNGQRVPLAQVAVNQSGRYVQLPGSRILVGDSPADGFGLAGVPGSWASLYPGQSPASYGLDPDKGVLGHDGTRGWVLSAQFLSQLFGASWRAQIYG